MLGTTPSRKMKCTACGAAGPTALRDMLRVLTTLTGSSISSSRAQSAHPAPVRITVVGSTGVSSKGGITHRRNAVGPTSTLECARGWRTWPLGEAVTRAPRARSPRSRSRCRSRRIFQRCLGNVMTEAGEETAVTQTSQNTTEPPLTRVATTEITQPAAEISASDHPCLTRRRRKRSRAGMARPPTRTTVGEAVSWDRSGRPRLATAAARAGGSHWARSAINRPPQGKSGIEHTHSHCRGGREI